VVICFVFLVAIFVVVVVLVECRTPQGVMDR
jgi:hypothetical protein